jgi:hypothetical protein
MHSWESREYDNKLCTVVLDWAGNLGKSEKTAFSEINTIISTFALFMDM